MDKSTAEKISKLMLEFGSRLNESVALVQGSVSESEFEEYRKTVGVIMGEMLLGILNPLYAKFPELKPRGLE